MTIDWPPGVGPLPSQVDDLCHRVLDTVVAFADRVGHPLPTRRYVSPGSPPWDCDQVTVHHEATFGHSGNITQQTVEPYMPAAGWALRAVEVRVTVIRCLVAWDDTKRLGPEQLPPIEVDEADAALTNADPQVVLSSLIEAITQAAMTSATVADTALTFGGSTTIVAGDMVGQEVAVTFDLSSLDGLWEVPV